ncbi:CHAD domain-containing protein [Prosthecobacter sp. SYSU 5D2]|uniref:CHAD domain-containing protein n=1 Tax=Prosthecobacter sp. SYSU 5D2 TaxID=3134134 RepID=UPI0031FE6F84
MGEPVTPSASAGDWLKALLLQLVDRAELDVADLRAHPQEALHRLRLRMKKAEALLRLSAGGLGRKQRKDLRKQMKQVKNAGGGQRDAEVVATLAEKLGAKAGLKLLQPPQPPAEARPKAAPLRALLKSLRADLERQPFSRLDWEEVADNYAACYRAGRRLMRKAQEAMEPETFHRWRKRVKALLYQTQALHDSVDAPQKRLERSRKLARLLGREQDLTLLEAASGTQFPDNAWQAVIQAGREKGRPKIFKQGGKLYRKPVRKFAHLHGLPGR